MKKWEEKATNSEKNIIKKKQEKVRRENILRKVERNSKEVNIESNERK